MFPSYTTKQGTNAGDPKFEIYDPDDPTGVGTYSYSWDCGETSRYFALDKTTAAITYAINFDLDDVNITVPFTCTVTVTDEAGLSGTTLLEIDIHDDNDNAPVFSQSTDYVIFAEPTLTSGRFVGQVRLNTRNSPPDIILAMSSEKIPQIILRIRRVSSGPLLSIDTFCCI